MDLELVSLVGDDCWYEILLRSDLMQGLISE